VIASDAPVHGHTLSLAQGVQRWDFKSLLLMVITAAGIGFFGNPMLRARGLNPSALFITPLFERAPSAKHPKLPRPFMAQFGNPFG
jgi:hypothetical protein